MQESALALVKLPKIPAGTVFQPIVLPLNDSPPCLPAHQLLPPQFGVIPETGESMLSLISPADEQDGFSCSKGPKNSQDLKEVINAFRTNKCSRKVGKKFLFSGDILNKILRFSQSHRILGPQGFRGCRKYHETSLHVNT